MITSEDRPLPVLWRCVLWATATVFYGLIAGRWYAWISLPQFHGYTLFGEIALAILCSGIAYTALLVATIAAWRRRQVGMIVWQLLAVIGVTVWLFWLSTRNEVQESASMRVAVSLN